MEEGQFLVEHSIQALAKVVREVKNDDVTPRIQKENYDRQLK